MYFNWGKNGNTNLKIKTKGMSSLYLAYDWENKGSHGVL